MAVTNLTGYTWVGNIEINVYRMGELYNINFKSKNTNFSIFQFNDFISYYPSLIYGTTVEAYTDEYGNWTDGGYRTIEILGGTDVDNAILIAYLEEWGTLTPPAPAGYEVTFVTNGGTSVTKLEYVEELPTPLPTTTKANNIFVGWFYDSGFEVQAFSGDTISSNITLYAKWYANMSDFYQDVADEIRIKNGETEPIKHTDFAYKIKNIQGAIELTQAQYDALSVYDDNTYYLIVEA